VKRLVLISTKSLATYIVTDRTSVDVTVIGVDGRPEQLAYPSSCYLNAANMTHGNIRRASHESHRIET
jgi:hypothetical protein